LIKKFDMIVPQLPGTGVWRAAFGFTCMPGPTF